MPLTLYANFGLPERLPFFALESPGPAVLMDIDGNGRPELIVGRFTVPGGEVLPLYALEFRPDGSLKDRTDGLFRGPAPTTDFARDILAKDVNGDGHLDLIIADHGLDTFPFPGATNLLLLSNGSGKLVNRSGRLSDDPDFTHSLGAGDVDGDGLTEILWNNLDAARLVTVAADETVSPFAGGIPAGVNSFTTATFANLDGRKGNEIVLGVDQNVAGDGTNVLASYADGSWTVTALPTVDRPEGVIVLDSLVTDIDGDGDRDILFLYTSAAPFYEGWGLQVLLQGKDGSFTDGTADVLPREKQVDRNGEWGGFMHLDDLNGDGRDDLVIQRNFDGDHLLFFQNAKGRFVAQDVYFGTQDSIALGDVNGDGITDIVVAAPSAVRVYEVTQETALDETVNGGGGADRLYGGHGDDTISGHGGADLILGGSGKDKIRGGNGKDKIEGDDGNDRLWGNKQADAFVFRVIGGEETDRIMDFNVAQDRLGLAAEGRGKVKVVDKGADTLVKYRDADGDLQKIFLDGVDAVKADLDFYLV